VHYLEGHVISASMPDNNPDAGLIISFAGRAILLDIEGTTSSVRFVYDVMVPFARQELDGFLRRRWHDPLLQPIKEQFAHDAGAASFAIWIGDLGDGDDPLARLATAAHRLMDGDVKATGLKDLQGLIWEEGYHAGRLRSHVYEDVSPALRAWTARGIDLRIYSSGSVTAQKVFFANTTAGDLLPLFRGHYDTTTGPKRVAESYRRIVADIGISPGEVLFLSDVPAELDAAAKAGLSTGLVLRPGNAPVPADTTHAKITEFGQVLLAGA
jgi:enolase-phosphatase E1